MARSMNERIIRWIEETIEVRLGLRINREKTKVLKLVKGKGFLDFLGFSIRVSRSHRRGGGPAYVRVEASKKSKQRARDKIRSLLAAKHCHLPPDEVVRAVNRFICGWLNYFSIGQPAHARWNLLHFAQQRVVRHLRRRSQRPFRPPQGSSLFQHASKLLNIPELTRG